MKNRLNLGCGSQVIEGFIGVDLCPEAELHHDLRNPLPFEDIPVDPIVLHHYVYEKDELKELLENVGFKDVTFTNEGMNHVNGRDWRVYAYKK